MDVEHFPDHPLVGKIAVIHPGAKESWLEDDSYMDYMYLVKEVYAYKPRKSAHMNIVGKIPGTKGSAHLDRYIDTKRRINFSADILVPLGEAGMNKAFSKTLERLEDE